MRVTKEKAAEHHEAIILAASRLFRECGFDGVSVIEVMKMADLTHGAFYGHFESKDALAAEACRHAFDERLSVWPAGMTLKSFVNIYLSSRHRDKPSEGCPVAAFASSIYRQAANVRREYAKGVEIYVRQLAAQFEAHGQTRAGSRKSAVVMLSALVGAITVARSVASDRRMSDNILAESRHSVAQQFGLDNRK
ncbi:TetR/AcrR family transcriptional regulator [Tardiphaga sp. 804_B3_N1_9]|uniref:TetR/AcrR family transcriptional regulator n=1 Tax=Tardiphaga sp. 804_B3_N1_9 TaxID=3240786 RepID=UPI003F28BAFC